MTQKSHEFELRNGWTLRSPEEIEKIHAPGNPSYLDPDMAHFKTPMGDMWFVNGGLVWDWTSREGVENLCILYCYNDALFWQSGPMFGYPQLPVTVPNDQGAVEIRRDEKTIIVR